MCKPEIGTKSGTMHELSNRHTKAKIKVFEWTGDAWSTPKTGFCTAPAQMSALGWRYVSQINNIERNT